MMTTAIHMFCNCYDSYMYPCYLRNGSRVSTAVHVDLLHVDLPGTPIRKKCMQKKEQQSVVSTVPATIMGFPLNDEDTHTPVDVGRSGTCPG